MLKYIFVILDPSANSFCYYRNSTELSNLMDLQRLKDVVFFAQKENMLINFLIGNEKLPNEYLEVMDTISHIKISELKDQLDNDEDILVIDYNCGSSCKIAQGKKTTNVIIRLEKQYLSELASITKELKDCQRLNVVLLDIETFTDVDFEEYQKQLVKIERSFIVDLNRASPKELNILTDRLVLKRMNNCEAGVMHITYAPNGKFYICPAFYYNDENDAIGDLTNGINIKNQQLYRLEYAPICKKCDSFQCKRCVYLNRKTTLEVNTPSHEQCVLSHIERNSTRDLLQKIRLVVPEVEYDDIPEIDYLDPIDIVLNNY